jgi:prepilin-type N-terminal cleavage/methylation domain-containing protein
VVNRVSHRGRNTGRQGWSLVELLVVLAIISILGAISIPIMRSFARDDMRNGARTVYTMLRAARMYAMSFNVETAVVYELDDEFLSGSPIDDSLRNTQVRCIRAAQVMYKLPDAVGLRPLTYPTVGETETVDWRGTFVPAPISSGERVVFADEYALLLEVPAPEYSPNDPPLQVYQADTPTVNLLNRIQSVDGQFLANFHPGLEITKFTEPKFRGIEELGMRAVYVFTGTLMDYTLVEVADAQLFVHPRMAHVFEPRGNLLTDQSKERYTLLFGPSPETFPTERIWFIGEEPDEIGVQAWLNGIQPLATDGGNLLGIPIEIHRATGRSTLGS